MIDAKEREIRDRIATLLSCKAFELRFTPERGTALSLVASLLRGPATLDEPVILEQDDRFDSSYEEGKREATEFAIRELEQVISKLREA